MNSGESRAGCSSSGRENGVVSLDPDQPHKKARFAWQIKGKHHLKIQSNEPTVSANVTPEETETAKCETVIAPLAAERILMTEYPTLNLPGPSIMQEDMCIARWQSTQKLNGSFDNTMNEFIETWMDSPVEADQRFLAMDMARIANEDLHSNDGNVENEGILMAINAHGLQSMAHSSNSALSVLHPDPAMHEFHIPECSSSEDCEILTTTKSDNLQWLCDERTNNSEEPANYEPWRPVHEIQNPNPTDQFLTAGEDYEYHFMNTAVIQAIKSKGLVVAGTDFG